MQTFSEGMPSVISTGSSSDMGGNWIWAFLLFAILGGGNGFGGGNQNTTWQSTQLSQIDSGVRAVQNGLCDTTYALSRDIAGVNQNLSNGLSTTTFELANRISECCCSTKEAIAGVNLNIERQTNSLVMNGNANTQKILDYMVNKDLLDARTALSEQKITSTILQNLQPPRPVPSYNVGNPYTGAMYGAC